MKTLNFIRHLWETEKLFLFFVFIVLVCSIGIIFIYPNFKQIWEDEINAPIAIVTVLVSIFIWRNQKKLAYEDQLPKKLDITFIWEDQEWKIKKRTTYRCFRHSSLGTIHWRSCFGETK